MPRDQWRPSRAWSKRGGIPGEICARGPRQAEAATLYRRVIALIEKGRGPRHPDLVTHLEGYAGFLRATGRDTEATAIEDRVRSIGREDPPGAAREPDRASP